MFGSFIPYVQDTLDVSALERNLIANNVSNSNTPGFKASKVAFDRMMEDSLSVALRVSDGRHSGGQADVLKVPNYKIQTDTSTKARVDGNNVDITNEMTALIRNNYTFNNSVQAINKEFTLYKLAIGKM